MERMNHSRLLVDVRMRVFILSHHSPVPHLKHARLQIPTGCSTAPIPHSQMLKQGQRTLVPQFLEIRLLISMQRPADTILQQIICSGILRVTEMQLMLQLLLLAAGQQERIPM